MSDFQVLLIYYIAAVLWTRIGQWHRYAIEDTDRPDWALPITPPLDFDIYYSALTLRLTAYTYTLYLLV